jgi:hypothetical protein
MASNGGCGGGGGGAAAQLKAIKVEKGIKKEKTGAVGAGTGAAGFMVPDDDEDDAVMIVAKPTPASAAAAMDEGEDDEIRVTGQGGISARDMPHARSLCAKNPFAASSGYAKEHSTCSECYCFGAWCAVRQPSSRLPLPLSQDMLG